MVAYHACYNYTNRSIITLGLGLLVSHEGEKAISSRYSRESHKQPSMAIVKASGLISCVCVPWHVPVFMFILAVHLPITSSNDSLNIRVDTCVASDWLHFEWSANGQFVQGSD